MRHVLQVVLVCSFVLAPSVARATQDHHREASIVLAWPDADAVIVAMTSFSPEAEGADMTTSWSIQKPPGVQQALVTDPYSKRAKLSAPKSTIPADKLDALLAAIREVAGQRLGERKVFPALVSKLGLVALDATKSCAARAKIARGRVVVAAGGASVDAGKATVATDCGAAAIKLVGRPVCYPHAGGQIVRIRTKHSCEGDNVDDRIVWLAP